MENLLHGIDFKAIAKDEERAHKLRVYCYRELCQRNDPPLLSNAKANSKTRKSMRSDFLISSLMLAHARSAGNGINTCPNAVPSCVAGCVGGEHVGLAQVWQSIMQSRIRKTLYLFENPKQAIRQLIGEMHKLVLNAENIGAIPCCRPNCFSDLNWFELVRLFHEVQFWDYTAILDRVNDPHRPANYHLTGSFKGNNLEGCYRLLTAGYNVALPFFVDEAGFVGNRTYLQPLPKTHKVIGDTFNVHDGDTHDLRWLDPVCDSRTGRGHVIGLRLKAGSNHTRGKVIGMRDSFATKIA